jgi:hypothetical protein
MRITSQNDHDWARAPKLLIAGECTDLTAVSLARVWWAKRVEMPFADVIGARIPEAAQAAGKAQDAAKEKEPEVA